jgi:hypothetical protein
MCASSLSLLEVDATLVLVVQESETLASILSPARDGRAAYDPKADDPPEHHSA